MLQETHSTKEKSKYWQTQLRGHTIFAHGSSNSRGVLTVFRGIDFNVNGVVSDPNGRFLITDVTISQKQFIVVNSYAPNEETNHTVFWKIYSML